jgi:hypothetical protein
MASFYPVSNPSNKDKYPAVADWILYDLYDKVVFQNNQWLDIQVSGTHFIILFPFFST